jgi:hypothetical protein
MALVSKLFGGVEGLCQASTVLSFNERIYTNQKVAPFFDVTSRLHAARIEMAAMFKNRTKNELILYYI